MAEEILTDRTLKDTGHADNDVIHWVDVSDTTQNAAGSSFKGTLLGFIKKWWTKISGRDITNTGDGTITVQDYTSADYRDAQATTLSITLADTVSTNHLIYLVTAANAVWVDLTLVSYTSPKNGAIVDVLLLKGGGNLTVFDNNFPVGFKAGKYSFRYIESETAWSPVSFSPLTVGEPVPAGSATGQMLVWNNTTKVWAVQTGSQETAFIKVSLSAAQIKTAQSIPILVGIASSGAGFYWRITGFDNNLNFGATPFTTISLLIGATTGNAAEGQMINAAVGNVADKFTSGILAGGDSVRENDTLSIFADADSLVGDSTIDCYITVQKVAI